MRVGFIGLGVLGKTIAKRLISQGVELIVWNRTKEKALDLGVEIAESPAMLTKMVNTIMVILFDSQASEEVIFGEGGLVEGDLKGKTVIDMTTNHYAYVQNAYKELKELGCSYLDAPVLGSVIPAQKGELTILVAGEEERFREHKPLFEKYCKNIYYVGQAGNATKLKLINNIVLGGFMEILAEAIAIGERAGFSKELIIDVLSNGAGKSYILDVKKQKILEEDFSTHFSVELIHKDLHYAQDLVKDVEGFTFALQNIKEAYGLAKAMGLSSLDFSAVYKAFKVPKT
ncbi:NAD(P)-dependent oxidoreductase [Thermocrinis sp.]|uniref:NAD(P)-dependent oxidoreductase n=1 Tax=Thermocrinis sp. TaxID=2024383 RepID=UPI002FDE5DCD